MKKENGAISSPDNYYKLYEVCISEQGKKWNVVNNSLKLVKYLTDVYFAIYAWFTLNPWYTYSKQLTNFITKPFWLILVASFIIMIIGNKLLIQVEDTYVAYEMAEQGLNSVFSPVLEEKENEEDD